MEARDISFEDIHVGDTATFSRTWSEKDVLDFAEISGDTNPLHVDEEYAKTTMFKQRLVHGMLLGSLCSQFVGMYIPGKKCLYLNQTLAFKKPVYIGDTVDVRGEVVAKSDATKIITIAITMTKGEEVVVVGESHAQVI